jgi:V/A-type H+-transporting ATPase subunit F
MGSFSHPASGEAGLLQSAARFRGTGDFLLIKIAVLTDSESAAGYRLAGWHVGIARDTAEARTVLVRMVQEDAYALIAVSSELLPDPYQAVKREMQGRDHPLLLALPPPGVAAAGEAEDARAYVRQLIMATMGHEIRL